VRGVLLCLVGAVLTLPGAGHAVGEQQLVGTVGPGHTIELEDSAGNPVTSPVPGAYDILVHDLSSSHNFHLAGPGVDRATTVAETGDTTWEDVVFQAGGTYTYVCDPHSADMNGSFTTGAAPPPPPGPPPPGPPPPGPPPPGPPAPLPPLPPPPPAPPPPAVPPHVHPLHVSGVRISIARRGATRFLVARARIDGRATAKLALLRGSRTRASARKTWRAGLNTMQLRLPRALPRGRWTAVLQVGAHRFKRTIRFG
jgi:plastocyanin